MSRGVCLCRLGAWAVAVGFCVLGGTVPASQASEASGLAGSGAATGYGGVSSAATGSSGVSYATARELMESDLVPMSVKAPGVPVGAFTLYSSVALEATYNDNVFATPTGKQDDITYSLRPNLYAVSDWSVHRLEFEIGGKGKFNRDFSSENDVSFHTGVAGLLEVRDDLHINTYAKYKLDQEKRGEGESFAHFDDPVEFQEFATGLSVNKRFNRFWVNIGGAVRQDDYKDTTLAGVVVDQDYRDADFYTLTIQSGFDVSPITSFYAEYSYGISDYKGKQFDSDGRGLLVGVKYELTNLISLDLAGGYLSESFDKPSVPDVETLNYRATLTWVPTELLTVGLVGRRYFGVSKFSGPSSTVNSELAIKGTYALQDDWLVSAGVAYQQIDYTSIARDDEVWKLLTSAHYDINANLSLTADYQYTQYDSNVAGISYERNEVRVGLSARY